MAAWQKKEKVLSPEEAIAHARSQLAPLWTGSEPRFAAIKQTSGVVTVHPLDKDFVQGSWMLFFLDPLTYEGQAFASMAREWHRRYSGKSMGSIAVVRVTFPFQLVPSYLASIPKQLSLPFPVALDPADLLTAAFGASSSPWVLLLSGGKPQAAFGSRQALGEGEKTVQQFLRSQDPGLPLAPLMEQVEGALRDTSIFNFSDPSIFPKPGFVPKAGATPEAPPVLTAHFGPAPADAEAYPVQGFRISGTWHRDGDRIVTSDPQARISFRCSGTHLAVIAESLAQDVSNPAEVVVELEGKPAFDAVSGVDLQMTSEGRTVVFPEVGVPRIFNVLAALTEKNRNVDLRFPGAGLARVALYGIRVGAAF